MKTGAFLLLGRTKRPDLRRTARPRFSPLSAGTLARRIWLLRYPPAVVPIRDRVAAFQTSTLDRTEGIAGKLGVRFLLVPENVRNRWSSSANRGAELPATAATVDQSIGKP
jgi:hypothetical protein